MTTVGIPVPRLLPIAGTWAGPFALYNIFLSSRVFNQRLKTHVYFGDKDTSTPTDPSTTTSKYSPLTLASHSHSNFLENVPLAFILLIIAELNGGNRKALHYTMATLLALRIAHAEAGLMMKGNFGDGGVGRPLGYVGSLGVLGGLGAYAGWLVKGYWGF
ncbi:hypothetical protein ONS95_006613 [Cadophora gregata]|uniref:uncharacterized protein n=1 Tax=Cadophora gregata TaxID=51156 RepID=UPI0026DC402B|nr:uncharacterized protein ONS95_006613 [Cadophora gregata]KAK0101440.1 hypothetical protein ONS95_006613 [Cadophora gregata]KAK0106549.1 hypothetical protein ONS96_004170 [Cadophora gregata f. sp. sojae]